MAEYVWWMAELLTREELRQETDRMRAHLENIERAYAALEPVLERWAEVRPQNVNGIRESKRALVEEYLAFIQLAEERLAA